MLGFRVWDSNLKEMVFDPEMYINNCGDFIRIAANGCEDSAFDYYIPMQSTGLTDCNGKEIFEGDVIRYYGEVLKANRFLIYCGSADIFLPDGSIRFDILGNRYQNPELLEKLKE